ncbi:MAG: acetyl-CoA carboxylase biotin carboxylase subunit, partial [Terriglobia bacterium]
VYSDADRKALHVSFAGEAYPIGPAPAIESYLNASRILEAARQSGAEAIHPGYGFLSENPEFARACADARVVFIGPSPAAMELMGSKTAARRAVLRAGLPVVPGSDRRLAGSEEARTVALEIGLPVMLKAAAGGGGKGMRLVRDAGDLDSAFRTAQAEAANAFGDPSLYIEKYIDQPRHIEIQIFGDEQGNLIHLGERECSLQRRHQKVLEESPSPFANEALRQRMGETAVRIGRLAGYSNAGTVEFLADAKQNFYFLEMNTRLQVEHPVTELVLGVDLVKEQIRIASGKPLRWKQEQMRQRGWALECRVYAEDPDNNFFPCPGLIQGLQAPGGPGVRDDTGVFEGWRVPVDYDPLLSKLAVWGEGRGEALARMRRALGEYEITGIKTNLAFFRRVLDHPKFIEGEFDTGFIDRMLAEGLAGENGATLEERYAAVVAAVLQDAESEPHPSSDPPTLDGANWKAAGRRALLNPRR